MEPPRHALDPVPPPSEAEDWEIWRLRLGVPKWLRDNPGLAISVMYVGASLVGVVYLFQFFRRFRLNVLEFTDASDFLMVVVREPLTIALALAGIPVYWLYMRSSVFVTSRVYRRWPRLRGSPEKREKGRALMRKFVPSLQVAFISVYALLFTLLYSAWQASRVRAGEFPKVTVEYKVDALRAEPFTATVIGSTARFLFVYRAETKRAEAIPFDSIARLSWDARSRRERAAAAEAEAARPAP
jgi:hypothetical protein